MNYFILNLVYEERDPAHLPRLQTGENRLLHILTFKEYEVLLNVPSTFYDPQTLSRTLDPRPDYDALPLAPLTSYN